MSNWEVFNINEISLAESLEFVVDNRGKTVPLAETSKTGIALIATNCISNDHLYPQKLNLRYVSQEIFDNWFRAHPKSGDIILTNKGSNNGEVCLVPENIDFCIAQDMVAVRADKKKIDPLYLFAALRSKTVQRRIKYLNVDAVIPHFKKTDFNKLLIPLPERKYQEFIGELYFNFSYKIENLRRQNETLEAIAQTLFKHWFIDFEFPNADGKPYKSSGGAMIPSELGEIPEGWRVENLKNVMTLNYGKSLTAENRINGKYPVVGSNGIVDTHTDFFVNAPGIVIGRKGTIGKVIWIEENFYPIDTTFYIEDNLGCEGLYFHYFLLRNQKFNKLTSDSAVPGLNRDMAYSVEFAISSNTLINQYNSIAKTIFDKINNNKKQLQTLTKTRDVLLPKLMSGQLRLKE